MLDSFSTNATVAKIRSVYGRMLKADDYHELVSKRNISEIAEYLSSLSFYGEAFRDIDVVTLHRGMLEQLLMSNIFELYIKLISFQELNDRPFYDFFIRKHECRQLCVLLNAVNNGLNDGFVTGLPAYIIKHSDINFIMLAKSRSTEELTDGLKGTRYYKLFKNLPKTEDGKTDLTGSELMIRTGYYSDLINSIEKNFSGSDRDDLLLTVKREVDIINIINSYRLKKYFGYDSDRIRRSILPFTQVGKATRERVIDSEDPDSMLAAIRKTSYGKLISDEDETIESGLYRRSVNYLRHTISKSTSAPVVLYAFMNICERELRNIICIIEGVRYDVDSASIYKLLVF